MKYLLSEEKTFHSAKDSESGESTYSIVDSIEEYAKHNYRENIIESDYGQDAYLSKSQYYFWRHVTDAFADAFLQAQTRLAALIEGGWEHEIPDAKYPDVHAEVYDEEDYDDEEED